MNDLAQRLTSARLVDLLNEVLTAEARMTALGKFGSDVRGELNRRGAETYERDGMAPTWRADQSLGTISYSAGKDSVVVTDRDDWASWAAQNYPDEVTATLEVPAAALPWVLELLAWAISVPRTVDHEHLAEVSGVALDHVPACLTGWHPRPTLAVREAWQKTFLERHTTVIEADHISAPDGQLIPGLGQRRTGRVGVSVRLNPEAKERATAELGDPMAFAVLTAPLGQVAAAHAGVEDESHVDAAAEGEPDYDEPTLPEVPLNPIGAAQHAIVVQGGFSTPAVEAFRILSDAMRIIHAGSDLDPRWRQGVLDTLAWLDEQADAEVDGEEALFAAKYPGDWRAELTAAVQTSEIAAEIRTSGFSGRTPIAQLRECCRQLQLPTVGSKRELFERLAARLGASTGDLAGVR